MSQQVAERARSFEDRANGRVRVTTYDQPDPFPWIAPTGFVSPRHEPKAPPANGQRCGRVKWYSDVKGYGFSACGAFIHKKNVVSGELRPGARICFDVADGAKGPQGVNVKVIG